LSELRKLADAKIDAERKKLLAPLHDCVETLKAKQSAAGILMSGNTLVELLNIFSRILESLRDVIITQYQWAISESLLSTQGFAEERVGASRVQVRMLHSLQRSTYTRRLEHLRATERGSRVHQETRSEKRGSLRGYSVGATLQVRGAEAPSSSKHLARRNRLDSETYGWSAEDLAMRRQNLSLNSDASLAALRHRPLGPVASFVR
jgi:hypothetical protein